MPCIDTIYNRRGEIIDSCPFIFEVNLDELETYNSAELIVKPLDPDVVITRKYYEVSTDELDVADTEIVESYGGACFYNDEDDELILTVFNGIDVALFNICSLLNIGRVRLDDSVPYEENGFAPVHDKVSCIILTLEEFKMLDGFVAWLKFTPHFILFKGLVIGANYIHSDVCEGATVPPFTSKQLIRGERLFIVD